MPIKIKQKDGSVVDFVVYAGEIPVLDIKGNYTGKNVEAILRELGGSDKVFIQNTEPTEDGLWIDTSEEPTDSQEEAIVKQIKDYINETTYGTLTTANEINSLNVTTKKQLKIDSIKGKTVVNLIPDNSGDCEDINKWSINSGSCTLALDSSNKALGTNSIKVTIATGKTAFSVTKFISNLNSSKYYCISGYLKNGNANGIHLNFWNSNNQNKTSPSVTDANQFKRVFVKIQPSDIAATYSVNVDSDGTGAAGQYAYFDGIMLEEITAAQYADSSFVPSDYVSSDMSVGETVTKIKAKGKNMLPPISQWTLNNGYVSHPTFDSVAFSVSSATTPNKGVTIPVKPNTTYTFKALCDVTGYTDKSGAGGYYNLYGVSTIGSPNRATYNAAPYVKANGTTTILKTFTTGADITSLRVVIGVDQDFGTFTFRDIQLEENSVDTTYEAYQETFFTLDQPLRSLPSGIKDSIEDNKLIKHIEKKVLDGNLDWRFNANFTGFKRVISPGIVIGTSVTSNARCLKFNNKELTSDGAVDGADEFVLYNTGDLYINIPNADSGWGDSYTPSNDEVKAYFMGYQMRLQGQVGVVYNGTGTKEWTSRITRNDGTWLVTTTLPTAPYDSASFHKLYYQLSWPVITELNVHNLVALPSGSLILEVDSQPWVKPSVCYKIVDGYKANIDEIEKGLSVVRRQVQSNDASAKNSIAQIANPNLLINGDFRVWQRGTTFNSIQNAYCADRWKIYIGAGTTNVVSGVMGQGSPDPCLQMSCTAITNLWQVIENTNWLSGKTVTISFDAYADSNAIAYSLCLTDGTAYDGFPVVGAKTISLTTTRTRYTATFTLPTLTSGNLCLTLFRASANVTIKFANVKMELGSIATPYVQRPFVEELAKCQRYYRSLTSLGLLALNLTDQIYFHVPVSVPMRITPTLINPGNVLIYNGTTNVQQSGFTFVATGSFGNTISVAGTKTAHGLTTGAYITLPAVTTGFDAEIY